MPIDNIVIDIFGSLHINNKGIVIMWKGGQMQLGNIVCQFEPICCANLDSHDLAIYLFNLDPLSTVE